MDIPDSGSSIRRNPPFGIQKGSEVAEPEGIGPAGEDVAAVIVGIDIGEVCVPVVFPGEPLVDAVVLVTVYDRSVSADLIRIATVAVAMSLRVATVTMKRSKI